MYFISTLAIAGGFFFEGKKAKKTAKQTDVKKLKKICSHWRPTKNNRALAALKHFLRGRVSKEKCVRNVKVNFRKYREILPVRDSTSPKLLMFGRGQGGQGVWE